MRMRPSEFASPGSSPERVMHGVVRIPVDQRRRHFLVVRIVNANVVLRQIIRLVLHQRDQVLAHDRHRHGPVRIEVDLDNLAVDVRRRPVRPADHGNVPLDSNVIFDGFDARGRNVHDDVARSEIGRQRLQAIDVDLELIAPRRRRHVHFIKRHFTQNAVDGQPVTGLEPPHRLLDIGIVDVVADRIRVEVAGHLKPRAQIVDAGVPVAEPQFVDLGHDRPAAARDNVVIGLDRGLGELRGRRRQRRRGRLGHVNGTRGLVESLPEIAPIGVAEQIIQRFGVPARGYEAAGGERRRAGKAVQKSAAVIARGRAIVQLSHGWRFCESIAAEFGQEPKNPSAQSRPAA